MTAVLDAPVVRRGGSRRRRSGHRAGWDTIVVLIPAHDEEEQIAAAIRSVLDQTRKPDLVVVVSDNSTDRTVEIARQFPVVVMETVGNTHRKAGALNQAWQRYGRDAGFVVTMDADSMLHPTFMEELRAELAARPDLGGVNPRLFTKAVPDGLTWWGRVIWRLVALDYASFIKLVNRRGWHSDVLGGYGTMFRGSALRRVAARQGTPWSTDSIVEDYRVTLDLRELGYDVGMCGWTAAETDSPTTLRGFWRQRLRWQGGTYAELLATGWQPWTRRTWVALAFMLAVTLARFLAVGVWTAVLLLGLPVRLHWVWLLPLVITLADNLHTAHQLAHRTWRDYLLAGLILPLELFAVAREGLNLHALWTAIRGKSLAW